MWSAEDATEGREPWLMRGTSTCPPLTAGSPVPSVAWAVLSKASPTMRRAALLGRGFAPAAFGSRALMTTRQQAALPTAGCNPSTTIERNGFRLGPRGVDKPIASPTDGTVLINSMACFGRHRISGDAAFGRPSTSQAGPLSRSHNPLRAGLSGDGCHYRNHPEVP